MMKRLDDSITALTKSLEYNPKHTEALYNKGVALKSKGMYVLQSRAPWHVRVGQVGGEIR